MGLTLATGTFPAPTRYTFGTMSIGYAVGAMATQIALVHQAMDLDLWFHTSQEYAGGGTFQILRRAFSSRPGKRPHVIAKIRSDDAAVLRFDVEDLLRRLDMEQIDIAQLCKGKHDRREIVDDLMQDGPMAAECRDLQKRGLVKAFSLELFTTCSADGTRAIAHNLFDLYSFYWNPVEREIAADTYAALKRSPARVLALRTLCGGLNTPEDVTRRGKQPYLAPFVPRFENIWPLVNQAGCKNVLELSIRYLMSQPQVLTTIGGTGNPEHLELYADSARDAKPLAAELVSKIDALHDTWAATPLQR